MTTPNDPRKSGPYYGDGVNLTFSFDFKVFAKGDILVTYFDAATAAELVLDLDIDYSVALNPDQDATPGGTITLLGAFVTTPPTASDKLAISGDLDYSQPADITNESGFFPETVENALDRLTMLIQQVNEKVGRALLQPITDTSASPEALILQIQALHAQVVSLYDSFDDRYLGPKASAPLLDNDGNTLIAGALYFDTTLGQLRVYNATLAAWQAAAGNSVRREVQTAVDQGGGVQTVFTLATVSYTPGTNTMRMYANGARIYTGITETDSTTVTVSPGVTAGESVLFETVAPQSGAVSSLDVGTVATGAITSINLQDALVEIGAVIGDATTAVKGVMRKATETEYQTGTSTVGALTPDVARKQNIVRATTVNASGAAVDFTSIPSWAKEITVAFSGLSTNGVSVKMLRVRTAAGWISAGYLCSNIFLQNAVGVAGLNFTDGFALSGVNAADVQHGTVTLVHQGNNLWNIYGMIGFSSGPAMGLIAGSIDLGANALTGVRITTQTGADNFDSGKITASWK